MLPAGHVWVEVDEDLIPKDKSAIRDATDRYTVRSAKPSGENLLKVGLLHKIVHSSNLPAIPEATSQRITAQLAVLSSLRTAPIKLVDEGILRWCYNQMYK